MNRASKSWWHKQRMTIRNTSGMHMGHYTYNIRAVLCSLQRFYTHYFINASVLRKWNYLHFKDEKPKVQRVKGFAQGQVRHLAKWRSQDYQVQKVHTKALPNKNRKTRRILLWRSLLPSRCISEVPIPRPYLRVWAHHQDCGKRPREC